MRAEYVYVVCISMVDKNFMMDITFGGKQSMRGTTQSHVEVTNRTVVVWMVRKKNIIMVTKS